MDDELKGRFIAALFLTVGLTGGLGWYLFNRDQFIAAIDAWSEDYAAHHSIISRTTLPTKPADTRWQVTWSCAGEPKSARVVYAPDSKAAVAGEKRRQRGKTGCAFEAAPTTKPYCPDRECGAASVVGP